MILDWSKPDFPVVRKTLSKIHATASVRLGRHAAESMKLEAYEHLGDTVVTAFAEFLGKDSRHEVERAFDFPASWWQHFKSQHFPLWLLDRFPVKMKRHAYVSHVTINRICPHDNVAPQAGPIRSVCLEWLETPDEP